MKSNSLIVACAVLAAPAIGQVQLVEIADGGSTVFGFSSYTSCINSDGSVVCGRGGGPSGYEYRWEEGIGTSDLVAAGNPIGTADLTADGHFAFGSGFDPSAGPVVAVRVDALGGYTFLPGPPAFQSSAISSCSDDGSRLFGRVRLASGLFRAAFWSASGQWTVVDQFASGAPVGNLSNQTFHACAADGRTAVFGSRLWQEATGLEVVPSLPGQGLALSGDGRFVFCAGAQGLGLLYDRLTGSSSELGAVPNPTAPGARVDYPSACNAAGDLAVGRWTRPIPTGGAHVRGVLWHRETGPIDLVSYVATLGVDFSGWSATIYAQSVSADGRVIAGYGTAPDLHAKSFILRFPDNWWSSVGLAYCGPSNQNSSGASAHLAAFGSSSIGANDLRLEVHGLPANEFGFVVSSRTQGFTPFPGGSQGNLCLGGAIGRHTLAGEVLNSGPYQRGLLTLDLTRLPTPTGFVAAQPGETWNFQYWFRDQSGGQQVSNLSDAVSILFTN